MVGPHQRRTLYIFNLTSSHLLMLKPLQLQWLLNIFAVVSSLPAGEFSAMAKGRKLTSNYHRNERLLGTYTFNLHTQTAAAADSPEFAEHDVWSTVEEFDINLSASSGDKPPRSSPEISIADRRRISGGLSLAFDDSRINAPTTTTTTASSRILHRGHDGAAAARGVHAAASAPVNVPDWSKILRCDSMESIRSMGDGGFEEEEESEMMMVPPHEYLARGRKMAANSVFEGVGRTLKGRDLRRVRDAVWSQTGFDG